MSETYYQDPSHRHHFLPWKDHPRLCCICMKPYTDARHVACEHCRELQDELDARA